MLGRIKPLSTSEQIFLDKLFRKHHQTLYQIAFSVLQDPNDANDAVINAMLKLLGSVSKLRAMASKECTAYLGKSVRHAAYKIYNTRKRKNLTESVPIDSILFSLPAPEVQSPDHIALKNEEYRQVRDAIATLPRQDREVLYLKYMAQMTAKEIAEMTNAPNEAAVQMRLSRARRKVLRCLEDWGWVRE